MGGTSRFEYSSNAWGYFPFGDAFTVRSVVERICSLGFDGFDLLVGDDAYPDCSVDEPDGFWLELRMAAEQAGGEISSLVLVSCPLQDEAECLKQFQRAPHIAKLLGADCVSLLPRQHGITQDEGFERLGRIWREVGPAFKDAGLTVCAENHVWTPEPDDDIFLLRNEKDFWRLIDVTDGGVLIKFDPVWLLKPGVAEQPVPAFERLLKHIGILDVKDCTFPEGEIVAPGAGAVDFAALAQLAKQGGLTRIAVEVEQHMGSQAERVGAEAVDQLHYEALHFYKDIFEK